MKAAEIVQRAGASESKRIRVVGVERLRPKGRLLLDHRMRNVVVIDPLDRRSHGNRKFLGREREIVDRDHVRGILRRYRTKRQYRADDRAQEQRNDQAAVWS